MTRALREIGPAWAADIRAAGDRTKALYLPHLACAPRGGIDELRDMAYGTHQRQVLDIYRPRGASGAPVIAFVHGGAFVRGAKDINGEMYANVLRWFARHGCVGINIEYRLAPDAPYPAGAVDVALACQWIERHVAGHGGDPARLCLVGHSAGGTHVATYACDPAMDGYERLPRGLVLISARLRADMRPENPNAQGVAAYFGDDDAQHLAQRSPVQHASCLALPVFVAHAEYENPLLDIYALEFAQAVAQAQGRAPWHAMLPEHNHVSIMAHFNTEEQWLGEQILGFCERVF
ncbi:MAG: alpha/beta hydrolase [Proteobacteria bacterium]|nr:alpha/beta hydrolase [Pseudomonadota bacterium]